mmetsp:Transcript_27/g.48  ORF Transcript_27/g.48 Transcript_27/m.48 type:complete len:244 (+) Transcript_27:395-1126(+)
MNNHDRTIDVFNSINVWVNIQTSQSSAGRQHPHSTGKRTVQDHASNLVVFGSKIAAWSAANRLSIQNHVFGLFVGNIVQYIIIDSFNVQVGILFIGNAATFAVPRIIVHNHVASERQGQNDLYREHCPNICGISVAINDGFGIFIDLPLWKSIYECGDQSSVILFVARYLDGSNGILVVRWQNQSIVQSQAVSNPRFDIFVIPHLANFGSLSPFFGLLRQLFHGRFQLLLRLPVRFGFGQMRH